MNFKILLHAILIAGCTSTEMSIKSEEYGVLHENVTTRFGSFRVYEHPSGESLMVTSSLEDAMEIGAVAGLTGGAANITPSEGAMQEAAEAYMARHSVFEGCSISNGYLIQTPVYEFTLDC